mmetsp:Transcript_64258/g.73994  ORF Transcript_64258/g.73994 Transcript_64258/m.73994 type:complete len:546 (-) Transcript_64258:78-1715(-)
MESTTSVTTTQRQREKSLSLFFNFDSKKVWEYCKKFYINFAKKYQLQIDVIDDTISKILFWFPHQSQSYRYDGNSNDDDDGVEGNSFSDIGSGSISCSDINNSEGTITKIDAWREVCYGILSLHRLMMYLALEENGNDNDNDNNNEYGTSVQTKYPSIISAKGIRICLTVVHSIVPSLLSVITSTCTSTQSRSRSTYFTTANKVRLILEQIKFLLRLYLLVPYWNQQLQQQKPQQHQVNRTNGTSSNNKNENNDEYEYENEIDDTNLITTNHDCVGVLMDGGMYRIDRQCKKGIPWDQYKATDRRRNYIGKRTGWKVIGSTTNNNNSYNYKQIDNNIGNRYNNIRMIINNNNDNIRTILGDLLYTFRPLLWAWFESRQQQQQYIDNYNEKKTNHPQQQHRSSTTSSSSPSLLQRTSGIISLFSNYYNTNNSNKILLRGWILCLGLDLLSIRLLERNNDDNNNNNNNNRYRNIRTEEEVQRRKLRLLLYALRSPVWSTITVPILLNDVLSRRILQKIPLLGLRNFIEIYIWDWILYYKHPFISEEG